MLLLISNKNITHNLFELVKRANGDSDSNYYNAMY